MPAFGPGSIRGRRGAGLALGPIRVDPGPIWGVEVASLRDRSGFGVGSTKDLLGIDSPRLIAINIMRRLLHLCPYMIEWHL